jgi:predicted nuclease of predicted toxin-antitoxin system
LDRPVLLTDENVHAGIIDRLRKSGFTVISVRETMAGASDREVLQKATAIQAILTDRHCHFGLFAVLRRNSAFVPNHDCSPCPNN